MKFNKKHSGGYTLIELMLVVVIMSILASITVPRFEMAFQRAIQSRCKSNLGAIRSGLNIYYSDQEGVWPLSGYPQGDTHYTADNLSLTEILSPKYVNTVATPKVVDKMESFNGISQSFDIAAEALMAMSPPKDTYIVWGAPAYTPLLSSPYAYDNKNGVISIPNGNLDLDNRFFYEW